MSFRQDKGVIRKSLGRIREVVSLPNLIEIQSKSFNDFVQLDYLPSERKNVGLEKVLRDIFPIAHNDRVALEYVSYELGNWSCTCGQLTGLESRYSWNCSSCKAKGVSRLDANGTCPKCEKETASYVTCKKCLSRVTVQLPMDLGECRYSGKTYSMPLKIKVQLVSWDIDATTGDKQIRDIKEQEVFFCDMPIMAEVYEENDGRFYAGSQGTFLINGVDRVVVSQVHRSPGVVFTLSKKSKDYRGNPYHLARIIPARGSWLDFEFDHNDILNVRIDKKRKIFVTTFLQALGIDRNDILSKFYDFEEVRIKGDKFYRKVNDQLIGQRLQADSLPKAVEKDFIVGKRLTKQDVAKLKEKKVSALSVRKESLISRVVWEDIVDPDTGEILIEQGQTLTDELLNNLAAGGYEIVLKIIRLAGYVFQPTIALTLAQDNVMTQEDAIKEIYYKLRPGDVAEPAAMKEYIFNLFFNPRFYDLSRLGRIRTNRKLGLNIDEEATQLTQEDIMATLRYLVHLKERGEGEIDDIDHLGNRCVRLVGELLQSQIYIGFARIEKVVRERFRIQEHSAALMPYDFLNVKPLVAVIKEFFGTGQLSQFMDQINPLSAIAHKRRLSALGPGGITRERATFEVRDVHPSHYGRICPIETPEGQNIGLISSLSTYARVNELGFIETTYRPVKDRKIQDEVVFMDAFSETGEVLAQATVPVNKDGKIESDKVLVRRDGNFEEADSDEVTFIDASPKQLVSVATALIPFLEHDDPNRALMGSNMQRQAVPLIKPKFPMIGTGIEREVGTLEGAVVTARNNGVVEYVSSDKIVIRVDQEGNDRSWFAHPVDSYDLKKFGRSNHNTWVHHVPVVRVGDSVRRGDALTDGPAVKDGDLALGSDVLVAYMPWQGYNFEDAIVLSKRMVEQDTFTSVHVEEFSVEARDTKLGPEEITRDIPNVGETALAPLDEYGIVRVGTRVKPGDILVGKVTLKGDVQYSPEEKLLRAIFGEKSREVRDTSMRVPPGIDGTVVDVKVFSRSGARKDERYKNVVRIESEKLERDYNHYMDILNKGAHEKLVALLDGVKTTDKALKAYTKKGVLDKKLLVDSPLEDLLNATVSDAKVQKRVHEIREIIQNQIHVLQAQKEEQIGKLKKGDDLPSGVIKMIRVYIAMKRPISIGDKMAVRHGNKGIVSRIVDVEDMPYMEDGTPVDIVLNPLGVPGRMNVGQILETMLGMAGREIGRRMKNQLEEGSYKEVLSFLKEHYGEQLVTSIEKDYGREAVMSMAQRTARYGMPMASPIFDGADYQRDIRPLLKELGLPQDGTYTLYDGRTGEPFTQKVTVGSIYTMKLNHLADDKLHARSVGPYSLITQQPLGGKAQFGGQRLGEMEVWALYAHGAAYTLQEMLTIKSDDVNGRVKVYEAIVRGDDVPDPGMPESFNVLVKELQSLGLQVDLFKANKEQVGE